jgi:hypothetical protein
MRKLFGRVSGFFEVTSIAREDLKRAGFYQDNAKRTNLQKQVGGVEGGSAISEVASQWLLNRTPVSSSERLYSRGLEAALRTPPA